MRLRSKMTTQCPNNIYPNLDDSRDSDVPVKSEDETLTDILSKSPAVWLRLKIGSAEIRIGWRRPPTSTSQR